MHENEKATMVYGVTIQTLDRLDGNGITMIFVEASDAGSARHLAGRAARERFGCEVVADHPVECPGFSPSPDAASPRLRRSS
jgi:hypothetical protein